MHHRKECYHYAKVNKLLPFLVSVVDKYPCEDDENYKKQWKEEALQAILREYRKIPLVKALVEEAEKEGIKLVFFKGYILAGLYHDFSIRQSGDTDIYVSKEDKEGAIKLLERNGYRRERKLDKEQVLTYCYYEGEECFHKIELHFSLYEDMEGEQIEKLTELDLTDQNKLVKINCCNMEIYSMGHREHLIYQMFHMIKHFIYQGISVRYCLDITWFLEKYGNEIDMKSFWCSMEYLGYKRFSQVFMSLCTKYFHLDPVIYGEQNYIETEEIDRLLQDLVSFGAREYGKDVAHYYVIFNILYEKLDKKESRADSLFNGEIIDYQQVPKEFQDNPKLQERFLFVKKLGLFH